VPSLPLRLQPSAAPLADGFERIRRELAIPDAFPADAEEEARRVAAGRGERDGATRADRRDLELITIDPAGSRDLDQALAILPLPDGHRVHYAIADAAAVVAPGGAIDREARARGVTVYMPDRRTPLHPPAIGEGAASLLPGQDRSALLWTIDLDREGEAGAVAVERALVRSRRALSYEEAQAAIDDGTADGTLAALREVGLARLRREADRGGVSLTVPVQEVVREGDRYALRYATPLPVEDWNAQISLLTGMAAARIMADGGLGLFRTLAPAEPRDVEALRRSALTLGVAWPRGARYGDVVRALDPARPGDAAFAVRATRLFHGAGYAAWTRESGEEPPVHAAIASIYAHVTAPLRRLADRFANEIVLALQAGAAPPEWAAGALVGLPATMAESGRRERSAERAAVDYVESALLAPRVGEEFAATVVDVREGRATVQLADPAVVAPLDADGAEAGSRVRVRVASADPSARAVRFELAGTAEA
jgi:exoribonuclease R